MPHPGPKPPETVRDALARAASLSRTRLLREVGAVDRAIFQAVARTPTPELNGYVRRLSDAANYSRLWFAIAGALALLGGGRGRRAAFEAVAAIAATSATVNLGVKPFTQRRRPTHPQAQARRVRVPRSSSFPSGHAASASAFAYAVGRHLPILAVPLQLLAGAVGYSRVHSGVHYPLDVAVGSSLGTGTAAAVAAICDRVLASPRSRD